MTTTAEPGIDLSLPPWTCWHGCGFETGSYEYDLQNTHLTWHTNQESRCKTLEDRCTKLEQELQFERNNITMLMSEIARVEQVIGTKDNYRFVEKTPIPKTQVDAYDPF